MRAAMESVAIDVVVAVEPRLFQPISFALRAGANARVLVSECALLNAVEASGCAFM